MMEFYLGTENSSGIRTFDREEFINYILEAIENAENENKTVFELEII